MKIQDKDMGMGTGTDMAVDKSMVLVVDTSYNLVGYYYNNYFFHLAKMVQ